jgi:hypothetical protein
MFAIIEAIARVPIRRRWLAAVRMGGLGSVAGIAFWWDFLPAHRQPGAVAHGENGSKHLLPLSVDGWVAVSSISLVELASQITAVQALEQVPEGRDALLVAQYEVALLGEQPPQVGQPCSCRVWVRDIHPRRRDG